MLKPMTQLAVDWAIRCFGKDHVYNMPVRALRLAEEAVELTQSVGVSKESLHELIDIVYSRPVGEPYREAGGVGLTLAIICGAQGVDPEEYTLTELRRVLSKPVEHFAERNKEKLTLGLDGS